MYTCMDILLILISQVFAMLIFKHKIYLVILSYCFTVLQEDASASNGNKDSLSFDGMADAEVERRLKVSA